jgi:hypothetical protein
MCVRTVNREMPWPGATDVKSAVIWLVIIVFFVLASVYVPA